MNQYGAPYGMPEETLMAIMTGEDNSDGIAPIPPASYRVIVEDVEGKQSTKGGWMWAITLRINDGGPHHGRKLFFNANWTDGEGKVSGGIGFAQGFLRAIGVQHWSGQVGMTQQANISKRDVVGKECIAVVSIQQTGQYAGRNSVDRVEPLQQSQGVPMGGAMPMPPAGGYPAAAPAPAPAPAGAWGTPPGFAGAPAPTPAPAAPAWGAGAPPATPAPPAGMSW